jgi:hypothetical protein
MRHFARRFIVASLLTSAAARLMQGQVATALSDSTTPKPIMLAPAPALLMLAPAPTLLRFAPVPAPPAMPRRDSIPDATVQSGEPHWALPGLEILGFLAINNIGARIMFPNEVEDGVKVYSSTFKSTWNHITVQRWVYDIDPFNTNQFQHPYQGASMFGFARSTGHSFWTSQIYANVGEFVWKMAGETDPPSINDMVTTAQAGSLLGEALYRMADLIIRDSGSTGPNFLHQAGALLISSGINRRILGNRFRAHLPDSLPAMLWQLRFGATMDALAKDVSTPTSLFLHRDMEVDFHMAYGLPGRPGYRYTRPFDYFDFQASVLPSTFSNFIENIMVRGLLAGQKTADRPNEHGVWGMYGSFDYISPYLFRVSSTALSLGTTREYKLGDEIALQGSLLGGIGWGAAGTTTIIPSTPTNAAIRDYHFGVTPQALLSTRLILGERAMFDLTSRYYYVSGVGSDDSRGIERIFRANFGATFRVKGGNALGITYVLSLRNATYGTMAPKDMREATINLTYTILGNRHFGSTSF